MENRKKISTGTAWETNVGYSRAIRVGKQIFVSGTISVNENGELVGKDNAYEQTVFIIKKIKDALEKAGASLNDVVRTRIFVTNINDWAAVGKAHGDFFRDIRPASTMLEISKLIQPEYLVEIEVDAVIDE